METPLSVQETFAARLKLLRKAHGYTQEQVAQMVNVERTTYNKYENGKSTPPLETMIALACVLSDSDPRFLLQLSPVEPLHVADDTVHLAEGVGELSDEETELVLRFRSLNAAGQMLLLAKLREEVGARLVQDAEEQPPEEE